MFAGFVHVTRVAGYTYYIIWPGLWILTVKAAVKISNNKKRIREDVST